MSQIKTVRTSGVAPHIPVIDQLSVTENGTYTAPSGTDGYSPVSVNVQPNLGTKNITQNGTYTASSDNLDGYSSVTVDVQEQPWSPLQDGYSNFWFELTNDTLSPWLNFSAKNNDAVIDWGDGSGEVALDTLTPTHTYTKAGKYVVKVKGVTGIAKQLNYPMTDAVYPYSFALRYVEFNSEVTTLAGQAFDNCLELEQIVGTISTMGNAALRFSNLRNYSLGATAIPLNNFYFCVALRTADLTGATQIGASAFYQCRSLTSITLPSTITSIDTYAFTSCSALSDIHIGATIPPTLGTGVFTGLPTDFIIYVPQGTGETYKAAAGWSAYADHIVEEGQTLSKAALRRIQAAEKNEGDDVR